MTEAAISPLRRRMIDDMTIRNFTDALADAFRQPDTGTWIRSFEGIEIRVVVLEQPVEFAD